MTAVYFGLQVSVGPIPAPKVSAWAWHSLDSLNLWTLGVSWFWRLGMEMEVLQSWCLLRPLPMSGSVTDPIQVPLTKAAVTLC